METKAVRTCRETSKTERDFYTSLSRLAEHYGISPMQTKSFGYPYNIALALWDADRQLKVKVVNWEKIRLVQDGGKTFLISEERYDTGANLYYVPVSPLYKWLKGAERRHTAQLLLSVYSYLYHAAGVPYYKQENSYLYWMYEITAEGILYDDENDDTPACISEIKQAQWIGERMKRKMGNRQNLSRFKERLNRFKIKDSTDHDSFMLACAVCELYERFPEESIFRNARSNGETEDEDMENTASMDKYVSFCASAKGLLYEMLTDNINCEMQEYMHMEEPVIVKRFDGSDLTGKNLDFEYKVFTLIEELIRILNTN